MLPYYYLCRVKVNQHLLSTIWWQKCDFKTYHPQMIRRQKRQETQTPRCWIRLSMSSSQSPETGSDSCTVSTRRLLLDSFGFVILNLLHVWIPRNLNTAFITLKMSPSMLYRLTLGCHMTLLLVIMWQQFKQYIMGRLDLVLTAVHLSRICESQPQEPAIKTRFTIFRQYSWNCWTHMMMTSVLVYIYKTVMKASV